MPSVRYYNQTAPFWDFVANLEQQGTEHPFFANRRGEGEQGQEGEPSWGWGPWGHRNRGFPFRGPPPSYHAAPSGPEDNDAAPAEKEKEGEAGPSAAPQEGESSKPAKSPCQEHQEHQRGPRGGCPGRRARGFFGGPGGAHCHGRGPAPWAPYGMHPFFASMFGQGEDGDSREPTDFTPEADVFDMESAFVIHVAVPGAQKEDVGVNWDAEKSELSVAGVIYRPGDEEFLKTLAMDERKVGPFEKKIRLGSRASPAQVDADMITAKLEDGVLRIEVPKLDKDYVEIKKVDIA
jgi:HSP20 family protein